MPVTEEIDFNNNNNNNSNTSNNSNKNFWLNPQVLQK